MLGITVGQGLSLQVEIYLGWFVGTAGHFHRLHMPDVSAVFPNSAIAREFASAGSVENGFASPSLLIGEGLADGRLTVNVGLVVR